MKSSGKNNANNDLSVVVIGPEMMAAAAALSSTALGGSPTPADVIPEAWEDRANLAWEYYTEEPIVKNAVNAWRIFAVGEKFSLACDDDKVREEALAFAKKSKLYGFVREMVLQLLVKGDCVGYKTYTKDGKGIEKLFNVNPVSVKVTYVQGELTDAKQFPEDGETTEGVALPLPQLIHLKWDAPSFSMRGNSIVLPAFQSISLLRDYRATERAIAKRWTTPLRFIKVGGQFGSKLIMPDQGMLERIRDMINKMDLKSGLVVPFYCDVKTYGTEGEVLKTEEKVKDLKEDIIVALGLARSIVTGDGPNFATASASMQKMAIMLGEIKQAARSIIEWVLDDWKAINGYNDKQIDIIFNSLDLDNEIDIKKLLVELYDRRLISKKSFQILMKLDPKAEKKQLEDERKTIDIYDEKAVKPITDMVNSGIMKPEYAADILGLDKEKNSGSSEADFAGRLFASASDELCDGCGHFEDENNFCPVRGIERQFDSIACRYFTNSVKKAKAAECATCR